MQRNARWRLAAPRPHNPYETRQPVQAPFAHFMTLLVLVLAGCARQLALDGRACPCAVGYVCDVARDTCVRDVAPAVDAGVGDGPPRSNLSRQLVSPDRDESVWRIWASGPGDLYAAGTGVFHSTGDGSWTEITPEEPSLRYEAIWGWAIDDLYMAVEQSSPEASAVLHRTGNGSWSWVAAPASITAIWGSAADDIWAVGELGTIIHSTGSDVWEQVAAPTTNSLSSVWGTSGVNAYAVGRQGTILKWDGTTWSTETSGTYDDLYLVWGASANEIYAVSQAGTILRSTGDGSWSASAIPVGASALWRSDAGEIYLVGCKRMLRLAGADAPVPVDDELAYPCAEGAWGTGLDRLYLVARRPFVYYRS